MSEICFDSKKSLNSFEDITNVYYALKSLGYTDEDLRDITGFLHDALNLFLINKQRENS